MSWRRHIELIALIRDIFLTVFAGVAIVVMFLAAVLLFRLYRTARRTARNIETISGVLMDTVLNPLSYLVGLVEMAKRVIDTVQEFRGRRNSEEEGVESA